MANMFNFNDFPQPFDAPKSREMEPMALPITWDNKALIPNEKQVGGSHYKSKGIQPWDYITSNNMGFLEGCIIKYVSRYQDKGGIEDLKKAQHFLEKLIEVKST